MVMPRSRSCAIQSVVVSPSWTAPILCFRPVRYKMPSVVVVLPASIWAMMPMFLIFASGYFFSAIRSLRYEVDDIFMSHDCCNYGWCSLLGGFWHTFHLLAKVQD